MRKSRWLIPIGIAASAFLALAGLAPIYLLLSDTVSSTLQNIGNLGQFISGVFAPVAFVWVVIAVLLQGRELELQREELRDTREVFTLQKEEMKRAADENREQTAIMKRNLENEASKLEYERVDTVLYSLAIYVFINGGAYSVFRPDGQLVPLFSHKRMFETNRRLQQIRNFETENALIKARLGGVDFYAMADAFREVCARMPA